MHHRDEEYKNVFTWFFFIENRINTLYVPLYVVIQRSRVSGAHTNCEKIRQAAGAVHGLRSDNIKLFQMQTRTKLLSWLTTTDKCRYDSKRLKRS